MRGDVEQSKRLGKQLDEAMPITRGDARAGRKRARTGGAKTAPVTRLTDRSPLALEERSARAYLQGGSSGCFFEHLRVASTSTSRLCKRL
jgi:hypothetical protein